MAAKPLLFCVSGRLWLLVDIIQQVSDLGAPDRLAILTYSDLYGATACWLTTPVEDLGGFF
jgi:hypothetical protein